MSCSLTDVGSLTCCTILIKSIFILQVPAVNVPLKIFAVCSHSFIAADDTTAVQESSPDGLGVLLLQIMMQINCLVTVEEEVFKELTFNCVTSKIGIAQYFSRLRFNLCIETARKLSQSPGEAIYQTSKIALRRISKHQVES